MIERRGQATELGEKMDLAIHDEILWCACVKAAKRMADKQELTDANDPRAHFPWLVRGRDRKSVV